MLTTKLVRPLAFIGLYAVWVLAVHLACLSFVTYFIASPNSHFSEISDVIASSQVTLMGLSSIAFVLLLYVLSPLARAGIIRTLNQDHLEKQFLPGFIRGAAISSLIVLSFILFGFYRFVGYFIELSSAPLDVLNIVLRILILFLFVYCEEYLFRINFSRPLEGHLSNAVVVNFVALTYVAIKALQFDLGYSQLLTLYLISLALHLRSLGTSDERFASGAGFLTAGLVVFNPLLSLPIFGNEFQGVLWFKYQLSQTNQINLAGSRYLTGGAGGPLSSCAIQLLLIVDVLRTIFSQRKVSVIS